MNSVIQVNNSDSKQDLEKGPSCNGIMKAQKGYSVDFLQVISLRHSCLLCNFQKVLQSTIESFYRLIFHCEMIWQSLS